MCGRFVSASPPDELAKYFNAVPPVEQLLAPNFNVAPTNDVFAVFETGGIRRLDVFHWGLVPRWAKDPSIGSRMINARAETLAQKNAYKSAFRTKRCLIPADGFYEWKKVNGAKKKQPMYIHGTHEEPLAIAGLWEVWRGAAGDELHSCTIITTTPNVKMAEVHDRMPVLLAADAWGTWLDEDNDDLDTLGKLLVPASPEFITMHPVSPEVNQVRNNGPELIVRVDPATGEIHGQGTLL